MLGYLNPKDPSKIKQRCKDVLSTTAPGKRSNDQLKIIQEYTTLSKMFPPAMDGETILDDLSQAMELLSLDTNTILFLQGQTASSYYITFSGGVDILQLYDQDAIDRNLQIYCGKIHQSLGAEFNRAKLGTYLCRLAENRGFGELALINEGSKRAASALATLPSEMIRISPEVYQRTLKPFHIDQANVGETFEIISTHILGEGLTGRALTQIAYGMESVTYAVRTKICDEGDRIDRVFLVDSGEIKELKFENDVQLELATVGKGAMIGAVDTLRGQKKYSSGFVAVSNVKGFNLSMEIFSILMANKKAVKKFLGLEASRVKFNKALHKTQTKSKQVLGAAYRQGTYTDFLARNLTLVGQPENRDAERSIQECSHERSFQDNSVRLQDTSTKTNKRQVRIVELDGCTSLPKKIAPALPQNRQAKEKAKKLTGSSDSKNYKEATGNISIVKVQVPPDLKTTANETKPSSKGFFKFPLGSSLFKSKNKGMPALGVFLGHKTAVNVYKNEDKRNKSGRHSSSHCSVDELLSNLEDAVSDNVMHHLSSLSRENSMARSRETSLVKSTRVKDCREEHSSVNQDIRACKTSKHTERTNSGLKIKPQKVIPDRLIEKELLQNPADQLCVFGTNERARQPNKLGHNLVSPKGHKEKANENKCLLKQSRLHNYKNITLETEQKDRNELGCSKSPKNDSMASPKHSRQYENLASPLCKTDKHAYARSGHTKVFFGENCISSPKDSVEALNSLSKSKIGPPQTVNAASPHKKTSSTTENPSPGVLEDKSRHVLKKEHSCPQLSFKRGNSWKTVENEEYSGYSHKEVKDACPLFKSELSSLNLLSQQYVGTHLGANAASDTSVITKKTNEVKECIHLGKPSKHVEPKTMSKNSQSINSLSITRSLSETFEFDAKSASAACEHNRNGVIHRGAPKH